MELKNLKRNTARQMDLIPLAPGIARRTVNPEAVGWNSIWDVFFIFRAIADFIYCNVKKFRPYVRMRKENYVKENLTFNLVGIQPAQTTWPHSLVYQ